MKTSLSYPLFLAIAILANPIAASAQSTTKVPMDESWSVYGDGELPVTDKSSVMSKTIGNLPDEGDQTRNENIMVAAMSLGAQAGSAARQSQIQQALLQNAAQYDQAFNFSKLMLEPGFLPPVITEGRDAYSQPDDTQARASDIIYRIERSARIVSVTPSWRTYLLAESPPPAKPHESVLPKTSAEKKLWDQYASQGWDQGIVLANQNFAASLSRLKQDFEGMIRFKSLYDKGLVTKPVLARANLGVTGGGNEMAINDRIIRITSSAALDANTRNWIPSERP